MSQKIAVQTDAPDFELTDTQGRLIRLSEVTREKPVVLVLLRAFA